MGLLDFLSGKPATTPSQGAIVVTPTTPQNYSTQTDPAAQVQKSYKDLQYPMPAASNNQLGTSAIPEANGLQPKMSYATESLPPISTTPAEINSPHVETILDNGVRQVTHVADSQPVESVETTTTETTTQPLYSYSSNPIPADLLVQEVPEIDTQPLTENQILPTNEVIDNSNVATPVATEVPGVTITPTENQAVAPNETADESKNGDIIEIGSASSNPVSDESQEEVTPAAQLEPIPEPVPEIIEAPVSVQSTETVIPAVQPIVEELPVVEVPPISEVTTVVEETTPLVAAPTVLPDEVTTTTTVEETKPLETASTILPEEVITTTVEENKPLEATPTVLPDEVVKTILEESKTEAVTNSLNVLNKIAFVSLNSQSVNSSLSQKIKTLSELLKSLNTEIYIDSNKGYGMDVISGLSGTSNKVTAAYLKPFYSKYSDETTLDVPLKNLTRITFSSILDRIKFLYKEATVFIIPETSGLNNLSQVLLLLSSQAMYFGSHKPVILFGTAWKDRMNSLKGSFALSQQEVDSMYFASTPDEVITLLKKLDAEFSDKKISTGNIIDMRDEQGEKEGLLAA